jgi:hypothetical protein
MTTERCLISNTRSEITPDNRTFWVYFFLLAAASSIQKSISVCAAQITTELKPNVNSYEIFISIILMNFFSVSQEDEEEGSTLV